MQSVIKSIIFYNDLFYSCYKLRLFFNDRIYGSLFVLLNWWNNFNNTVSSFSFSSSSFSFSSSSLNFLIKVLFWALLFFFQTIRQKLKFITSISMGFFLLSWINLNQIDFGYFFVGWFTPFSFFESFLRIINSL
jgi:hypothetical protein